MESEDRERDAEFALQEQQTRNNACNSFTFQEDEDCLPESNELVIVMHMKLNKTSISRMRIRRNFNIQRCSISVVVKLVIIRI